MKERIDRLIKIADFLDRNGREDDADFIDQILVQRLDSWDEESTIDVPEDEYNMLEEIYRSLGESLKSSDDTQVE